MALVASLSEQQVVAARSRGSKCSETINFQHQTQGVVEGASWSRMRPDKAQIDVGTQEADDLHLQ